MKFNFLKDKKCWCFAAGIATAVVGKKIAQAKKLEVCAFQVLQRV